MGYFEYCTKADVLAECANSSAYTDAWIISRIQQASSRINELTGMVFANTTMVLQYEADGRETYITHYPIIGISSVKLYSSDGSLLQDYPVGSYRNYDKSIMFIAGGVGRLEITGTFGTLENGATPLSIKQACIRMTILALPKAENATASDPNAIASERMGDYAVSYKTDPNAPITGDGYVDDRLRPFLFSDGLVIDAI